MYETGARVAPWVLIRILDGIARSEPVPGQMSGCLVLFGTQDPVMKDAWVPWVVRHYQLPETNVRWMASGGHFPHLEDVSSPESTARNRDELVRTIDGLLLEARQGTMSSTDLGSSEEETA
jgi:hypothetical protein